jgi:hypothetical protein
MIEWEREIPPIAEEYPFYDQTQSVLEILILRNENIEKSKNNCIQSSKAFG